MCLYICECVFACLYTHGILSNTYTDIHYLPLPCVQCCHLYNSEMPPPHPIKSHPVSPFTLFPFSLSLPPLPSIMHVAISCERKEEREEEVVAVFSCFLPPYLHPRPHWRVRGEKLRVNACDLSEKKLCTLPQH